MRLGRTAGIDIDGVPLFGFTEASWRAETSCEACEYAITSLRGEDRHNGPAKLRAALTRQRVSRAAGEMGVLLQCDRSANVNTGRYIRPRRNIFAVSGDKGFAHSNLWMQRTTVVNS